MCQAYLRKWTGRSYTVQSCALGSARRFEIHVGLSPDGSRMRKTLLVLLCLANRWSAAAAEAFRSDHQGNCRTPPQGFPVHRACRRQLLSRFAYGYPTRGATEKRAQSCEAEGNPE